VIAILAAAALAALPEGAARYRVELGRERIGTAALSVRCEGPICRATYESRLRLPEEAGGAVRDTRVEADVDRSGRHRGGRVRFACDGVGGDVRGIPGAVPASLAELVLLGEAGAGRTCVDAFEEEGAAPVAVCARREGGRVRADRDGIEETIAAGPDGFPAEVRVAGRLRFVRDEAAEVPARAPRLVGARVAGPEDPRDARAFCGVGADLPAAALPAGLPPPRAAGASCKEKTAAWLVAAERAGFIGRTAVGVAWDGGGFVWHAWAEVRAGGGWVAVDPSFGEAPARGPRFTVGRFAEGDRRAREAAGRAILGCWGTAAVE
jgi:hypothetical protein